MLGTAAVYKPLTTLTGKKDLYKCIDSRILFGLNTYAN